MNDKEFQDLEKEASKEKLSVNSVDKNPLNQFKLWYDEILKSDYVEPTAMTLATASKERKPSARMLLLKAYDQKGYVFYTNYNSRKGKELGENPNGCILFYWDRLKRQVRIEGKIEKVAKEESEAYFKTRSYKSRLGAWASNQSSVIESRTVIVKEFLKYLLKFRTDVPLPEYWGGYRLIPEVYEFWQGRENRLHDRIKYTKEKDGWKIERLAP
ncbi:MAG: pyridoxamine 5'-phosphate oxidase [Chlorobi bacterium]|nr:pyridoxamine 5'-phosphate oxidase [Chlorobiota bacterium]MCI0715211.1 pyridoxamine 5'-phosphate oxidase [Chlorobiota bacterium]